MIVSMEYAEDAPTSWRGITGLSRRAVLTLMGATWMVEILTGDTVHVTGAGLDRREAMQRARRWVETGTL